MPPEAVSLSDDPMRASSPGAPLPPPGPPEARLPPAEPGGWLLTATRATVLFGTLALFWLGTFLFALTALPLLRLFVREPTRRRRLIQRFVSGCFRAIHALLDRLSIYHCTWIGEPLPQTAAVIVANHPSFLDFTAIAAACPTLCCVVKPLLMRNPFVGRVLKACGHVDGRSESLAGAEATLTELRQRLAEGFPVLIFPEGTRSPAGGLHAFRRGAFRLASIANVPVRPLVLDCHPPALGKHVSIWQYPRVAPTLTIEVQPEIQPTGKTPGALRDEFEKRVRDRLAQITKSRHQNIAA